MTRTRYGVLLGSLVALVALLGSCTGADSSTGAGPPADTSRSSDPATPSSSPATPTPSPQPPRRPPAHGCYRLTFDDALAPTSSRSPVPCAQPHTSITVYVGQLPRHTPVDGPRVHSLVSTVCPRRFAAFVGGTLEDRRLSLLRPIWFTPTLSEADAGSRWFRCEAIAVLDDQHLARLTGKVGGVLDRPDVSDRFALCGSSEPGTTGFQQRICSAPHSWKALRTVALRPGRYPGVDTVRAAGQATCKDAGSNVASDPLDFQWSYQWPTLKQWRAGQTYGVCWAPSS